MHYKNLAVILFSGLISTTITLGAEIERNSASLSSLTLVESDLISKVCQQVELNVEQTSRHCPDTTSLEKALRDPAQTRSSMLSEMIVNERLASPLKPELKYIQRLSEEAEALEFECSNKSKEQRKLSEQFKQKLKEEEARKTAAERILSKKEHELQSVLEQTRKSKQKRLELKERREQEKKRKAEKAERKRELEQEKHLIELQKKLHEEKLKAEKLIQPLNAPQVLETKPADPKGKGEEIPLEEEKAESQHAKAEEKI